ADIKIDTTPNKGAKFSQGMPDSIVIHYTAGPSVASAVNTFKNPTAKVSAHLVIGRDGEIVQMVPFDTIAWHAGKSEYNGRSGYNNFSIGIEIVNAGLLTKAGDNYLSWFGKIYSPQEVIHAVHSNEQSPKYWHVYTEKQIETVEELCR